MIRTFVLIGNRKVAGNHVNQTGRNKKRRHFVTAGFIKNQRIFINRLQAADAGTHHNAGTELIFVGLRFPAGIFDCIAACGQTVKDKLVNFLLVFGSHNGIRIKLVLFLAERNLAGYLAGNVLQIDIVDFPDARFTVQNVFPVKVYASSERRNHTQSGYNNSSH